MNRGIRNEIEISNELNNKKIYELKPLEYELIHNLYGNNLDENEILKCRVDNNKFKYDIIITYKNINKYISIKMGSKNGVHVENLYTFIDFLYLLKIPKSYIYDYKKFHFADGTHDNSGNKRISTEEFIKNYPKVIKNIKLFLNNKKYLDLFIDRFLISGVKTNIKIDGLIYGTKNDFIFISRNELYEMFYFFSDKESESLNISMFFIGPFARCLNYNQKYEEKRMYIQVKWYDIFGDYFKYKFKHLD